LITFFLFFKLIQTIRNHTRKLMLKINIDILLISVASLIKFHQTQNNFLNTIVRTKSLRLNRFRALFIHQKFSL